MSKVWIQIRVYYLDSCQINFQPTGTIQDLFLFTNHDQVCCALL